MVLIVAPTLGVKASIGIVAIPTTKSKVSKKVVMKGGEYKMSNRNHNRSVIRINVLASEKKKVSAG